LRQSIDAGRDGLTLRQDPTALAPETLIVFEISGSHVAFAAAVAAIDGLSVVGEEFSDFLEADPDEAAGFLYIAIPDQRALNSLLSLWNRYRRGEALDGDFTQWNRLFASLHDVRRWGPKDRVSDYDRITLLDLVEGPDQPVTIEIELAFYSSPEKRISAAAVLERSIVARGGRVVRQGNVPEISYHAVLATVPGREVIALANREEGSLAGDVDVFAIRPQSVFEPFTVEAAEPTRRTGPAAAGSPILAIFDGVPATGHPLLADRLILEDPDDLSALAVGERRHGTAMASLAIWGDLQVEEMPLSRPILVRPVTYAPAFGDECFPDNALIPDDMVRAVRRLVAGDAEGAASAPSILIINVSLGDRNKPFFQRLSAWARALDWLSYEYGILFVVSAGNAPVLRLNEIQDGDAFARSQGEARTRATFGGLRDAVAERTILSPAEATNVLTVGACHHDAHNHPETLGTSHNPAPHGVLPSLLSRVGPGFLNSVKPDILLPGGKLRVQPTLTDTPAVIRFSGANRFGGLLVAGPDAVGTAWSGATSAAAALGSRAAHQIHDACEAAYGAEFAGLSRLARAAVVKALLVHRATIPNQSRTFIESVFGPVGERLHARRKKNLQRVFGFGIADVAESIACVNSRATLWGYGIVGENDGLIFDLPIPPELFGNRTIRTITATLAWFSPIVPGRRAYKSVRLQVEEPDITPIGIKPSSGQAEQKTTLRGTVFHRSWSGATMRRAVQEGLQLIVSRRPDTDDDAPDQVPFGIAVSIESDDPQIPVYERVLERIAVRPRVRTPARVTTQG
jgi:hypothetical protein